MSENCKNFLLIISLIVTSCLITHLIHEQYVQPKETNQLISEMRQQFNTLHENLFSLDEIRAKHMKNLDRTRRLDDEKKRTDLWKRLMDLYYRVDNETIRLDTSKKPRMLSNTTPIPIRNQLYSSVNDPSTLLVKLMSRK